MTRIMDMNSLTQVKKYWISSAHDFMNFSQWKNRMEFLPSWPRGDRSSVLRSHFSWSFNSRPVPPLLFCLLFHNFIFPGSGGRDLSGNKRTAEQSFDQTLTRSNAAIAVSCNAKFNDKKGNESTDWQDGKPIRVCRSWKFQKHSKFAPDEGVR